MFGFSWSEILIIGVVALVFIGPNDLPRAMKTAARWMSAGRKLAREFQGHVDELVREADLDDLREQARKLAMTPLSSHIETFVDPDKEIAKGLAAPDNLHEFLSGVRTMTPLAEPAESPPAIAAPEPTVATGPVPADPPPSTLAEPVATGPKPRKPRAKKVLASETEFESAPKS
jgi:sec-independent protein translocase protein TatB